MCRELNNTTKIPLQTGFHHFLHCTTFFRALAVEIFWGSKICQPHIQGKTTFPFKNDYGITRQKYPVLIKSVQTNITTNFASQNVC